MLLERIIERDNKKDYEKLVSYHRDCVWRDDRYTQIYHKSRSSKHFVDTLAELMITKWGRVNHLVNHIVREDMMFIRCERAKIFE